MIGRVFIGIVLMIFLCASLAVAVDYKKEDVVLLIEQTSLKIQEMAEEGYPVSSLQDRLIAANESLKRAEFAEMLRNNATGELAEQARDALQGIDYRGFTYNEVIFKVSEINAKIDQAYGLSDSIRAFELEIDSYQEAEPVKESTLDMVTGLVVKQDPPKQLVDTSEAESFLSEAKNAFEKERYDEVLSLIEQAQISLEEKHAEINLQSVLIKSSKGYFAKNWPLILFSLIVIVIILLFVWRIVSVKRTKTYYENLKNERKSINSLMKKIQIERFRKGQMPEMVYRARMKNYQKRLAEVKEELPVIKARLKK